MTKLSLRAAFIAVAVPLSFHTVFAAGYRTENFIVTAPSRALAREIGDAAESYRRNLAIGWLGQPLPRWHQPCPISVQVGANMGAGGATSFMFEGRQPFGWRMSIQGSRERLLDSVLPHEVTHTIFATHFGRPLPRWADEGACTTVEHASERARQDQFLEQFLRSSPPRSIAFNRMFRMTEYPHDILPLYAQGHSVARYLIQQGGKRRFVDYVGRGMDTNNWDAATEEFYGYRDLSELQVDWVNWVAKRSPQAGIEQLAILGLGPKRQPAFDTLAAGPRQPPIPPAVYAGPTSPDSRPGARQVTALPTGQTPNSSNQGWYERQRDQVQSPAEEGPEEKIAATSPSANLQWLPGSARVPNTDIVPRAMARPQPAQQPSPMVLEWEQRAVAAGPGVQLRRKGAMAEPPVYHDAPSSVAQSTLRR